MTAQAKPPATSNLPKEQTCASGKLALPARTPTGTNWTAAFVLRSKGMLYPEIATELGLILPKLLQKARSEDWDNLIRQNSQLTAPAPGPEVSPLSAPKVRAAAEKIQANRDAALAVAQGLRGQIIAALTAHAEKKTVMDVDDIAKLAKAAASIDNSAMLALGDDPTPLVLTPPAEPGKSLLQGNRTVIFNISPPSAVGERRRGLSELDVTPKQPAIAQPADPLRTRAPTPANTAPLPAVILEPTGNDGAQDVSKETMTGRATVDFGRLAKEAAQLEKAAVQGTGLPAFARGV